MRQLILGLFSDQEKVDTVLIHLQEAGLRSKGISVIAKEDRITPYHAEKKNLAGEGALTGGILGGVAGLLVAATPIMLPGVGIFAVGPAIILSGFAMGAVMGGLLGALVDLGVSANQAKRYERRIRDGGVLLAIPAEEKNVEDIQEILEGHKVEELTIIPYKLKMKMIDAVPLQATNAAS